MSNQTIIFSFGKNKWLGFLAPSIFLFVLIFMEISFGELGDDFFIMAIASLGLFISFILDAIYRLFLKVYISTNTFKLNTITSSTEMPLSTLKEIIRFEGINPDLKLVFNDGEITLPKDLFFDNEPTKRMDLSLFLKDKCPDVPVEINTDYAAGFGPGLYDIFYHPRIKASFFRIYAILHLFIVMGCFAYYVSENKTLLSNAIFVFGLIVVYYCVFKIMQNPLTYKIFAKGAAIAMVVSSALLVLSHFIR